jgi:hypothetical protein
LGFWHMCSIIMTATSILSMHMCTGNSLVHSGINSRWQMKFLLFCKTNCLLSSMVLTVVHELLYKDLSVHLSVIQPPLAFPGIQTRWISSGNWLYFVSLFVLMYLTATEGYQFETLLVFWKFAVLLLDIQVGIPNMFLGEWNDRLYLNFCIWCHTWMV